MKPPNGFFQSLALTGGSKMKRPRSCFLLVTGLLLLLGFSAFALTLNNSDLKDGINGWIGGRTAGICRRVAADMYDYSGWQAVNITFKNPDGNYPIRNEQFAPVEIAGLSIAQYDPVGIWDGSLDGIVGDGLILEWRAKTDQTITGSVVYFFILGGTTTLKINTTYTNEKAGLNFTATGIATFNHPTIGTRTSAYTLFVRGTFVSDTEASGKFAIKFAEPTWIGDKGTWTATKTNPIGL